MSSIASGKDTMFLPADYYRLDEMFRDKTIANFGTKTITSTGSGNIIVAGSAISVPEQNTEIVMPYEDCLYSSLSASIHILSVCPSYSQYSTKVTVTADKIKGYIQIDDVIRDFELLNPSYSYQAQGGTFRLSVNSSSINSDNITFDFNTSDNIAINVIYKKMNRIKLHLDSMQVTATVNNYGQTIASSEVAKLSVTYGQPFKI